MKLQFEIALDKLEEFSKKFLVLSNVKRLKLLLLLKKIDEPLPSAEIHRRAKGGGLFVNRETTYRALEDLVKIKIVSKFYDEAKKKIVYCIKDENDP